MALINQRLQLVMIKGIVIDTGVWGFHSPDNQMGHSIANDLSSQRRFYGVLLSRRSASEMDRLDPATRYTLLRNTASRVKI